MLTITVPKREWFDEKTNTFEETKEQTLQLEHSLVSLARWESKWKKPFISKEPKTNEELIDYIKCMTITQNINQKTYLSLSDQNLEDINNYIDDPMTATTIHGNADGKKEVVTAEIIYYWMIALNIPMECQKWHLNRLLMLIQVTNIKNQSDNKMSKADNMAYRKALNASRRAKLKKH